MQINLFVKIKNTEPATQKKVLLLCTQHSKITV